MNAVCTVAGCERRCEAKGLCQTHYRRLQRGQPLDSPVRKHTSSGAPEDWLRAHTNFAGGGCLIWPFRRKANGRAAIGTGSGQAHRLMCEIVHGLAPFPGAQATHDCGNGHLGCVNPRHLSWKTTRENALDRWTHGTMASCERAPAAKITKQIAAEIRLLHSLGWKLPSLSKRFGLSKSATHAVIRHKTWDDDRKLALLGIADVVRRQAA
jgi:hypothetical protein